MPPPLPAPLPPERITGLLLAGGRGMRMGGVDKGLQAFDGLTLAQHVLKRLRPQVGSLLISANRNSAVYASLGAPVLADATSPDASGPSFDGPLAGILAGLKAARTDYVLAVPCDSPFIPADLAARLSVALLAAQATLALVVTTDVNGQTQRHPVFALLSVSLADDLEQFLASGQRQVRAWYARHTTVDVPFLDDHAFYNINTLQELNAFGTPPGLSTTSPATAAVERIPDMPAVASADAIPARFVRDANMNPDTFDAVASCITDYDPNALPVESAQTIIQRWATPVATVEKVALRDTLGRVLAADVVSPINVPAYNNSAMDGYAFDSAQLNDGELILRVAGRAVAGRGFDGALGSGECLRIMTGAPLPDTCDTIVPQEQVTVLDHDGVTQIRFASASVAPGANRRFAGEDLAAGHIALAAGRIVTASDLGLIASLGIAELAVRRRLRVAFFSTGDELRSIGEVLDAGCVYDSNRYTLYGMLHRLGVEIIDLGIVRDSVTALETAFRDAAASADVVITSGGVSVGEADLTRQLISSLGDVVFWKIAMRPGRPLAFGRIWPGGVPGSGAPALLFGLPGNPVAVMVTFYHFVRGALLAMMGATPQPLPLVRALSPAAIRKRPGRTEYQRGVAERSADGQWHVTLTGTQGSGILSSMSHANCFVILPHEAIDVPAGGAVDIMLFDGLI